MTHKEKMIARRAKQNARVATVNPLARTGPPTRKNPDSKMSPRRSRALIRRLTLKLRAGVASTKFTDLEVQVALLGEGNAKKVYSGYTKRQLNRLVKIKEAA